MKLILLRHGKTEANEKHLYCGSTDLRLSEKGKEELLQKKRVIAYPDIAGFRVLSSGMARCEETLAILYGEIPHETDGSFCEMNFGAFEMRSYEEMKREPAYLAWISNDNEANRTPGGESGKEMSARVRQGLKRLIAEGQDVLLFTHGGVIAACMAYLFTSEEKNRYEWQPKPGEGYWIDLDLPCYREIGLEREKHIEKAIDKPRNL